MMRQVFPPVSVTSCLLGLLLWGCRRVLVGQDVTSKGETPVVTSKRAVASIDPRYRSPRATVRTFLIAMNQAEDDPQKIVAAVACLDLAGIPPEGRDEGRMAFALEFILRST